MLEIQPKSVVKQMFSSAEVALITQTKEVKNIVMPSKVFGPASVEKRLIVGAAHDCEVSRLARKHNSGTVVTPEEPDRLVAAINRLKKDRKWAELMGKNGRLFMIKEHKTEKVIGPFEEAILKNHSAEKKKRKRLEI